MTTATETFFSIAGFMAESIWSARRLVTKGLTIIISLAAFIISF